MRVSSSLAVVVALSGVALAADTPAEPITKPGEKTLFDGKLKVQVADDGNTTKFAITFVRPHGTSATKFEAKSAAAKGWFVVAESASRVWVYQGDNILVRFEYEDNPPGSPMGGKSSSIAFVPGNKETSKALAKAPKSVVERLPEPFKVPAKNK